MTAHLLAGTVVTLDEIAAGGTSDRWVGYVTDPTTPRAVRIWRGRLDIRSEFTAAQILEQRTPTAAELTAAAHDIAASIARERTPAAQLRVAQTATQLEDLATLRRQAEVDETRERQRPLVNTFNAALERRRTEWARSKGRRTNEAPRDALALHITDSTEAP